MKNSVFILAVAIAFSFNADAQDSSRYHERTSISFGGQVGIPQDEFKEVYGEASYGIGGTFVTKNRFPFVYTGLNYSYARMGKLTNDVRLSDGENIFGTPVFETYDATVANKIHRVHLVARFKPFKGKVQPYIEGMAGGAIYNTRMSIEDRSGFERVENSNLETSLAGSIGWSAGLKVEVARGLFVEGRVENLMGSNVRYMDPESLTLDSFGNTNYNMLESQTNSRIFQIGIALDLYENRSNRRRCN